MLFLTDNIQCLHFQPAHGALGFITYLYIYILTLTALLRKACCSLSAIAKAKI